MTRNKRPEPLTCSKCGSGKLDAHNCGASSCLWRVCGMCKVVNGVIPLFGPGLGGRKRFLSWRKVHFAKVSW